MKLKWETMESAPKDREILIFGTAERGTELVMFGAWTEYVDERWEWITQTADEQHQKKVKTTKGFWSDGVTEIFPILWADVERPMARQKPIEY